MKLLKAAGPTFMTIGGVLFTIGYFNDASVGKLTYKDSGTISTTDTVFTTAPGLTINQIRKTDGTSYTLKLLGSISFIIGGLFELSSSLYTKDDKIAPEKI